MNKAQQLLRDSNIIPTDEIIAVGLGETNTVYTKFIEELKKYNISLMDIGVITMMGKHGFQKGNINDNSKRNEQSKAYI